MRSKPYSPHRTQTPVTSKHYSKRIAPGRDILSIHVTSVSMLYKLSTPLYYTIVDSLTILQRKKLLYIKHKAWLYRPACANILYSTTCPPNYNAATIARLSLHDLKHFELPYVQTLHRLALLQHWRIEKSLQLSLDVLSC